MGRGDGQECRNRRHYAISEYHRGEESDGQALWMAIVGLYKLEDLVLLLCLTDLAIQSGFGSNSLKFRLEQFQPQIGL